jgi:hypothetical protein
MDASIQSDDASVGLNLLADASGGLPQQVRNRLPALYNYQKTETIVLAAAPRSGIGNCGTEPVCRGNRGS